MSHPPCRTLEADSKSAIFGIQSDVIDGSYYQSLLQWLAEHAAAEEIELSSRPMTRAFGATEFELRIWHAAF